jgi:hypothetical protein
MATRIVLVFVCAAATLSACALASEPRFAVTIDNQMATAVTATLVPAVAPSGGDVEPITAVEIGPKATGRLEVTNPPAAWTVYVDDSLVMNSMLMPGDEVRFGLLIRPDGELVIRR